MKMENGSFASAHLTFAPERFRLPESTRLGRVHLRVRSIEQALGFYRDLLGMEAIVSNPAAVVLRSPQTHDTLLLLSEDPVARPRNPAEPGLFHIAFLFGSRSDLALALRRLLDHRWPIHGAADHGVSEAIYLADAEGNGIELYADRAKNKWPYENGRLRMVTEPLDLEDLLRAAPRVPASEKPPAADCSVGHIHLQVSDLSEASRLYGGILGFDITQDSYEGALFFSAGGYHHHIGVNTWRSRGIPRSPGNHTGLIGFSVIPGIDGVADTIARRARAASMPVSSDGTSILLADSHGFNITITPGPQHIIDLSKELS